MSPSRLPVLLLAAVSVATAQIHAGVALGVPLTDTLNSTTSSLADGVTSTYDSYHAPTERFLAGPVLRMQFSRGWGMEFDALWQRVDYDHSSDEFGPGSLTTQSFEATTGNRWQFPLLAQYTRHHIFGEAGLSISHIGDSHSTETASSGAPGGSSSTSSSTGPGPSLTQPGVTVGGGADFRFLRGHLRPEIRYTHWFSQSGQAAVFAFLSSTPPLITAGFNTNANEAAFLLNWTL